jgi:hypothetical protein
VKSGSEVINDDFNPYLPWKQRNGAGLPLNAGGPLPYMGGLSSEERMMHTCRVSEDQVHREVMVRPIINN